MSRFDQATLPAESAGSEEQIAHEAEQIQRERVATRMDRRKLITNLSMAAGAAGVLGLAGCSAAGPVALTAPETTPSVVDILNFALNLEYFEASFYSYIATGAGLPSSLTGTGAGTVSGGAQVTFTNSYVNVLAQNLASEEMEHVALLRATIQSAFGVTPVSMPALNLAALGAPTDDASFVALARTIEGVGSSAYAGGAQYLVTSLPALNYAAQILDLEAQHEGALRAATIYLNTTSPAADALDIPPTLTSIFNTSPTTGLNAVRTISQVLGIVYGQATATTTTPAAGIAKGGFFPNGLNGNIYYT